MQAFVGVDDLVVAIHAATAANGQRFSFAVTGGGSTSLSYLMAQPGASSTVLEFTSTCNPPPSLLFWRANHSVCATVTLWGSYASESTIDYINRHASSLPPAPITSFASADTASALAHAARARSINLMTTQASDMASLVSLKGAVGVGATAALASKAWKRGDHRVFVALSHSERDIAASLNMHKGSESAPFRTRQQEDDLCGKLIVCLVAHACGLLDAAGLRDFMLLHGMDERDVFVLSDAQPKCVLQSLLDSSISNVLCLPRPDATLLHIPDVPIHTLGKHTSIPPHIVALPGSFNPLHPGHAAALHACVEACDPQRHAQPLYELSVFNVDKPPVPLPQLQDRLTHFSRQNTCVLLTNTPRFVDKARAYPGMSYVVGVDTLLRLVDPLYTQGSVDLMTHALEGIAREGSVFYVLPRAFAAAKIPAKFGLQMQDNELLTYGMVESFVPVTLRALFKEVSCRKHLPVLCVWPADPVVKVKDNAHSGVSSSALRQLGV